MKLAVVAVLLALGCGSKKDSADSSGSAAPRPTVTDPIGFCERARLLTLGRTKCFPEDTSIKMGLEQIDDVVNTAPAEPQARRRVAVTCALMLDGMMRAQQPKNCPLDVTEDERTELATFLAAWYGERTAAPTTGIASLDATLVKLAAQRDAACACKDLACARTAADALDAGLPSDAPAPARDAAAKMVDEVARCKQKLTNAR